MVSISSEFQLRIQERPASLRIGLAAKQHRRGDEALHQVALGRADIGFVDIDPGFAQTARLLGELTVVIVVQAQHRAMVEVAQPQWPQVDAAFAAQRSFCLFALRDRHKRHRRLPWQANMARAVLGREPEFDLGPGGRVAPMAGEQKSWLKLVQRYPSS